MSDTTPNTPRKRNLRSLKRRTQSDISDKLREKAQKEKLPNKGIFDNEAIAEFLGTTVDEDGIQEIKVYPEMNCSVVGCGNKAVGADDVCKAHGGNPVITENLLPAERVPTWIANRMNYDPAVHPMKYITLSQAGMSEVEIAAELGVSVKCLQGWNERFLEFNQAYEIGNAMYEAWWLQQGKDNLDNRSYNVGLFKFLTGQKLGYSDKIESRSMHVHAGVLLVPASVTPEEWEKEGQRMMENRNG